MKNTILILLLAGIAGIFSSCSITLPFAATNNPIGAKTGTSENTCLFSALPGTGLCFNSDWSIYEAAKQGKISKVATVDLKTTNMYLFKKFEFIVTGE